MPVRAEVAVEVLAIGKLAGKLSRPGLGSFGLNDWKIFFFPFFFGARVLSVVEPLIYGLQIWEEILLVY